MQLFTTPKVIGTCFALALPLIAIGTTAQPAEAAAKKPVKAKPKVTKPIDTVGAQVSYGIDVYPIIETLETRMGIYWKLLGVGPSKYCEIHFNLLPDGRYSDPTVWRSSGDPNYDRSAIGCIDQSGPFAPFEGVDRLPCVATFRTEPKGGDVSISMPGFQASNSRVDKQIAAKRQQNLNVIKLMKDRITAAQKVLGSDSPKLSESINFLGNTYKDIKDWSSAEASYKWAISIREKANGPNSKELAGSLSDLGDMYAIKGDQASAEDCFKRVINMTGLPPCVELRTAMQRYATLCLKTGRTKDSEFLYQRINDMQMGKPMAPLPANMTLEAAKPGDAAKPEEKPKVEEKPRSDEKPKSEDNKEKKQN
ncbi:MAG: tetratricopeptide repeat protein [Cyanobacteria bacterium SZAS TMP-1]|nr:tetratricopeptide repeat protein [Cyanobacteria bacterium SZAS TMP-1]